MPTLPTSFPSGYEPTADDYQAIFDLLNQIATLPGPTVTGSIQSPAVTTTETLDSTLGTYAFTVPAAAATWRYVAKLRNAQCSGGNGDLVTVRIRDGGASTPTNTSTLIATTAFLTSSTGFVSVPAVEATWIPGAGTHTLGVFIVRTSGAGSEALGGTRELSAHFDNFS